MLPSVGHPPRILPEKEPSDLAHGRTIRAPPRNDATEEELVDEEWHALVDEQMSKSPRSAHWQLREDRRFAGLQRAWEQDRLRDMEAKLERYQQNAPEYERSEVPLRPGGVEPPFSQRRQQEILEEFQRQKDLQVEKEEQEERERLQQERQRQKEERRQQRRDSRTRNATRQARQAGTATTTSTPVPFVLARLAMKISRLFRRAEVAAAQDEAAGHAAEAWNLEEVHIQRPRPAVSTAGQVKMLVEQVEEVLASSADGPDLARRRIFRELQRTLHPDKNDGIEAYKLAFQHLMNRRRGYLQE